MKKQLIKYLINPLGWGVFMQSNRFKYLKEFELKQFNNIEENKKEQQRILYKHILYIKKNIPYYKKIIQEKKIKFSLETIYEDLKKLPILSKQMIQKNYDDLINKDLLSQATLNTSGGSTGKPVAFYQDKEFNDRGAADNMLHNTWGGWQEGELLVKLWGSEADTIKGSEGSRGLLVRHGMNELILNTFVLNEENIQKYISIINKKKPRLIVAYVQSAVTMAKYILENKIQIHQPQVIIVSAGTLYKDFRITIEKAFSTKVLNRYGSREIHSIGCECDKQEGIHINILNNHIEIIDKKGNEVSPGETGEIIITNLRNKVMPLIRYQIGDIAQKSENEQCSCQRGFPLIKTIRGRDVNLFVTKHNNLIDGEYFTHLFYHKPWIEQFQVVQETKDLITIRVVKKDPENEKDIQEINELIHHVMEDINIEWRFEKHIESTPSGKYLYTMSKVKQ